MQQHDTNESIFLTIMQSVSIIEKGLELDFNMRSVIYSCRTTHCHKYGIYNVRYFIILVSHSKYNTS